MKLYDIDVRDIRGKNITLSEYADNVMLIVNTATDCGFSYQLEGFQTLFENYNDKGFFVLAFPSNSFKKEPNDNPEIQDKCNTLFNISFPLFEKVSVKGNNIHPLFNWLINHKRGLITKGIKYNYTKFLIDRQGHVVKRYSPLTKAEKIKADIEALL